MKLSVNEAFQLCKLKLNDEMDPNNPETVGGVFALTGEEDLEGLGLELMSLLTEDVEEERTINPQADLAKIARKTLRYMLNWDDSIKRAAANGRMYSALDEVAPFVEEEDYVIFCYQHDASSKQNHRITIFQLRQAGIGLLGGKQVPRFSRTMKTGDDNESLLRFI